MCADVFCVVSGVVFVVAYVWGVVCLLPFFYWAFGVFWSCDVVCVVGSMFVLVIDYCVLFRVWLLKRCHVLCYACFLVC